MSPRRFASQREAAGQINPALSKIQANTIRGNGVSSLAKGLWRTHLLVNSINSLGILQVNSTNFSVFGWINPID
jgi:hypothetical protein